MAAGSGAASGHGARSSTNALEASLDRRFQGVSNTMESIQGLSTWCIENKKHHGVIVRYWMKWLKKSDNNHRLNLFYLANDVIQNCKRKNAIVFRSAFAEVLPNAVQLIKDGKVRKSVERIFTIWEERSVYPEEVISQLKASFNKKEKEREKQKEKEKEKEKETPPSHAPANTKAALKSKIVAEFTPQSLIEQLSRYKRAVAEEEFREKQLAALRVDVCSTEALKRLKDKAGGNKFAKDFEDGSLKLQEFVSFLEKELKTGPPLLEALGNADIFYETQYKEVKIVANAYNAFANRVASLKRKLDSLKSTLPGPEDSPIPSPSEDAPSPTGSDSPFLGLGASRAQVDPELDGKAMDEGEIPNDNRDMEDMDMSDEEADAITAGADEKKEKASAAVSKAAKSEAASKLPTTPTKASKTNAAAAASATPATPTSATAQSAPATPLGVNLAKVDLGKISSILSSLTSAMKNTAASPSPRPSPGTPTTPSGQSATSKATPPSPALASILSRVDITPEGILNALSKTNTPGLSSLLQSVTNTASAPPTRTSPESSTVKTPLTPTTPKTKPSLGNSLKRDTPGRTRDWDKERQLSPPPPPPPRPSAPSVSPPSLESKINSFLQGNPGFSLALGDVSPDGVDGTPVRDEAAGTPTQDEIMDTPGSVPESLGSSGGHNLSPTAYRSEPWDAVITPSGSNSDGDFLGSSSSRYGAGKKSSTKLKDDEANARRQVSSSPSSDMKGKKDGQHSQLRMMGINRAMGERRLSAGSRKASTGSDDGGKREDKGKGQESPGGDRKEGQYHRIETLVSPCTEGAPIQTLGYSNRPLAGERIKTVESIRVIGRGSRRGGGAGGRPGGAMWYEEEEYMEAQPPSPHAVPPPLNIGPGGTEDMNPSMPPPHPQLLLPPHLHPPPSHPHLHPPPQFQMPYHTENIQTPPPSHLHQHPPPTSPFFSGPPPIPRPPPPPVPQRPSPPPTHPAVPTAVMVGGVLVPVDRPLTLPPPIRPEGAERGGVGPRGHKVAPPPLMTSLLGEPPRPGTVKEPFVPRHAPPLHRPGTPGVPPPLLGRVKEPMNLPLPSPSPSPTSSTPSPSTPNSPAIDSAPARLPAQSSAPPLQKPPTSPPAPPRSQPSNPVPLLNLPTPRPPILSVPISQRPLLRGRNPSQQDLPMGGFRGGKRPGPPFTGGPFHHGQKRPFLPPRY
ncbi:regulation of nuclear pre-mRNA domain-containing protein 2-like isoform X1 [Lates japonicus]